MRRFWVLFMAALVAFCSCGKTLELEYPELGEEFQCMAEKIDLSQLNKFDESLFSGTWVLEKFGHDWYLDGELVDSFRDYEERTLAYTFDQNHTMTILLEDPSGQYSFTCNWLYAHNYLMLHFHENDQVYYCYEVVDIKSEALQFRQPYTMLGEYYSDSPFPDMNGVRMYQIYEFKAQ